MRVAIGLGKETDSIVYRCSAIESTVTGRVEGMPVGGANKGNRFSRFGSS